MTCALASTTSDSPPEYSAAAPAAEPMASSKASPAAVSPSVDRRMSSSRAAASAMAPPMAATASEMTAMAATGAMVLRAAPRPLAATDPRFMATVDALTAPADFAATAPWAAVASAHALVSAVRAATALDMAEYAASAPLSRRCLLATRATPAAMPASAGPTSSMFSSRAVRAGTAVPVRNCTASRSGSVRESYTFRASSSRAELRAARSPPRLSVMVVAVCSAAPAAPYSSSRKPASSSEPALRSRFSPLMESAVKVVMRADARSASPMPLVADSTSARMSAKSR